MLSHKHFWSVGRGNRRSVPGASNAAALHETAVVGHKCAKLRLAYCCPALHITTFRVMSECRKTSIYSALSISVIRAVLLGIWSSLQLSSTLRYRSRPWFHHRAVESNKCRSSTSGTNNPFAPLTTPSGPAPSCRLARGISHTSVGRLHRSARECGQHAGSSSLRHTNLFPRAKTCLYLVAPIRSVNGGLKWNCFGVLNIRCCNLQTSSMSRVNSRAVSQTLHFPHPSGISGSHRPSSHALQIRAVEAKPPFYRKPNR